MQRLVSFLLFLCLSLGACAQTIQTIVPSQPVVKGTAFQVQYVIASNEEVISTDKPLFDSFRVVSGPNHYKGNAVVNGKLQPIENITFTLVPLTLGKLKIAGLRARFKNLQEQQGAEASIMVIDQPSLSFTTSSSYTDVGLYAPPSKADLQKMVKENLFIRVLVNKNSCLVGEPLVATFKLYSRLQSASELVKAPALYGFSAMDILDINQAHQEVETLNGKVFNTSILRKVQLYPEQAGRLVIDPMVVQNEIEFRDTVHGGMIKVERELETNPVVIQVRALPASKPEDFTGAVGTFRINARMVRDTMTTNEQGKLMITIGGRGNFVQFAPPPVPWPKEFDVFDPLVSDQFNIDETASGGSRTYTFPFTVDTPGHYQFGPVRFSFFDLSARLYTTVQSDSVQLLVLPASRVVANAREYHVRAKKQYWWLAITGLLLVAGVYFFFFRKARIKERVVEQLPVKAPTVLDPDLEHLSDKQACMQIQKVLTGIMKDVVLTTDQQKRIRAIQAECEMLVYSEISQEGKKEELKNRVLQLLAEVKP